MNLYTKKKMLRLVDDLLEGIKQVKAEKEDILPQNLVENLSFSQLLIEMMGTYLDTCPQEYDTLCKHIHDYGANATALLGVEGKEPRKPLCKAMEKSLEKLRFEIKKRVPEDKKELVFFPYNYSMWDSLASVWRAAVDSQEFEVSVVPIPYYDKNPDGSFGKMHYHGAEYPEEVGILSWETYDLAERKPEVAYIHNPYDASNYVTSIHPNFYIDQLKKHIASVVYIPYFVALNDFLPAHFCTTPVTFQADKIIVQSQAIKEIYSREMYQLAKTQHPNLPENFFDQRILPLGSPKHDSAYGDEEISLPTDWKNIIYKEDGSRKKVVFFNTSLGTILEFKEAAMDKIQDCLSVFFQQREEIALLWRPHPLTEATLHSMVPHLHRRYEKILSTYRQENWGILDESKDFPRAVAISDAYYGHGSSVVSVFEEAKKPVMIVNNHIFQGKI